MTDRSAVSPGASQVADPRQAAQAAKPLSSFFPALDLKGGASRFSGRKANQFSFVWHQNQMAAWAARESDPDVVDSIGVLETIALVKTRLEAVVRDYLEFWASNTRGNSDEFHDWLEQLSRLVGREIQGVWRKDQ